MTNPSSARLIIGADFCHFGISHFFQIKSNKRSIKNKTLLPHTCDPLRIHFLVFELHKMIIMSDRWKIKISIILNFGKSLFTVENFRKLLICYFCKLPPLFVRQFSTQSILRTPWINPTREVEECGLAGLPIRRHCPQYPSDVISQQGQLHNVIRNCGWTSPTAAATEELFNHLRDLKLRDRRTHINLPGLYICMGVSRIEGSNWTCPRKKKITFYLIFHSDRK